MTIKQQGGIFGRNPTFNDVTVTGAFTSLGIDDNATSTAVTITSGQKVGVGTTSPSYPFVVSNGGAGGIEFVPDAAAGLSQILAYDRSGGGYDTLRLNALDHQFNTSGTNRVTIDASGHAIIPAGVTLGTTAGVYAAANTLDDYEEGTWTPTYLASTTNPTFSSYVFQTGYYTKIGQMVYVSTRMRTNGYNSDGSGNLRIGGLPFTSATVATIGSGGSVNIAGSYLFSTAPAAGYFVTGADYIQLNSNLSFTASTVSALSTSAAANDISFFGVYRAS
jgi:hypothetical protein